MNTIEQRAPSTMEAIGRTECLQLLRHHELGVGRLALVEHPEPSVVATEYAIVESSVVFRTGPGTSFEVGNPRQHVVFEVESAGDEDDPAWDVVIRGWGEIITPSHALYRLSPASLSPHSNDGNDVWVMIHPESITGHRAGHDAGAAFRPPVVVSRS